ncbi:unnamed protein product [Trifolium pratense]|uniref:Uncharacterized protein n=2 Tax=Trifolium pratense TaxID=57577 RepID=A0ACB0J6X4_TRIPR|nr:unnamed protein product [Trifolium pratense]
MMASSSIPVKDAEGEKPKVPNWLNLPRDITANILGRLSTIYMVTSVCLVCPLWWNICKDPHIWRTIQINYFETYYRRYINYFDEILRYAVDRSCGHLEDIEIDTFCSDELLEYIAENASNLRCLRLEECRRISEKGFIEAVRKLPLLEEVYINSISCLTKDSLEALGRSCPHLKSLEFVREGIGHSIIVGFDDNDAVAISETMPRLRSLDINRNRITNIGLLAILDGCPLLEYLNLERSLYLDLSESLRKRCLEQIKDLRLLDNKDDLLMYYPSDHSQSDEYYPSDHSESGGLSDDENLRQW